MLGTDNWQLNCQSIKIAIHNQWQINRLFLTCSKSLKGIFSPTPLLQTIQCGLPWARRRRVFVVYKGPAGGIWDWTYSGGNSVHIDNKCKYFWSCWENHLAELWTWTWHSEDPFLYPFLLKVCFCLPSTRLQLHQFLIFQTTGRADGHNHRTCTHPPIARPKKISDVKRNLH